MSNRCCEPAGGSEQVGFTREILTNVALAMQHSAASKRETARAQHHFEFTIIIIQFSTLSTYSKNRARAIPVCIIFSLLTRNPAKVKKQQKH